MANTLESHVLLHVVDKYGNVQILYPRNFGKDVQVETSENSSLPNNISSLQDLVDNLDKMAFQSGDDLVRLGNTGQEFEFDDTPMSEINDDVLSYSFSFSSKKVRQTTIEFESYDDINISDIDAVPTTCKEFIIDGRNAYGRMCPTPSVERIWHVKHIPMELAYKSNTALEGMATKECIKAIQIWTGNEFTDNTTVSVKYERIYKDGNWGAFHTI